MTPHQKRFFDRKNNGEFEKKEPWKQVGIYLAPEEKELLQWLAERDNLSLSREVGAAIRYVSLLRLIGMHEKGEVGASEMIEAYRLYPFDWYWKAKA